MNIMEYVRTELLRITNAHLEPYRWFGYFSLRVKFLELDDFPGLAAATITNKGMIIMFNKEKIKEISIENVYWLVIHELSHLFLNHCGHSHDQDTHRKFNYIHDMLINKHIDNSFNDEFFTPIKSTLYLPDLYASEVDWSETSSRVYEWFNDKLKEYENDPSVANHPSWNIKPKNGTFSSLRETIEMLNKEQELQQKISDFIKKFLEENDMRELDSAEREIAVEKITIFANNYGNKTDDKIKDFLNALKKPPVDNLKYIKNLVNSYLNQIKKQSTWSKPHRRFSFKPGSVMVGNKASVLLDTSGSMSGRFEIVLSEIYRDDFEFNLIECDTEVHNHYVLDNKTKLNSYRPTGLGGTDLQPGFDYALKNFPKDFIIILTDGECPTLNLRNYNKVLIISCSQKVPTTNGSVKQIILEYK